MLVDYIHTYRHRNLKLCNLFIGGYEINKYKPNVFSNSPFTLSKAFSIAIQDPH
jgi:hypothetical protein